MEIQNCPVLRPSPQEFQNFYSYVEKIDKLYKNNYGMVKVIPPANWKPRTSDYASALQNLVVAGPIEQNIFGKGGVYQCLHIQKKSLTLKEYYAKTAIFDKMTEGLSSDQVEKMFWKSIVFSPPLYGADLLNSLMEESAGPWNMNHLDSVLQHSMEIKVKGVNTPYCYIGTSFLIQGSWKTLFCWHKEDLDLSAMNFLHEGKSKFWYSIPSNQSHILEQEAFRLFPEQHLKCSQFLRHKTTLINPYLIKAKYPQLKITKTEHKKGQFVLVFGGAYHCGFNFGFNIAEAVNYGTLSWLGQLLEAKPCACSRSCVRASHLEIMKNLSKCKSWKNLAKFKNSKEFGRFKEKVLEQEAETAAVEKHEEEEEDEDSIEEGSEEIKAIKSEYSKKIKKGKRGGKEISKLKYKGEQYEINHWAECEHCHKWRKLSAPLKSKRFYCKNINKKCTSKEKMEKSYITL